MRVRCVRERPSEADELVLQAIRPKSTFASWPSIGNGYLVYALQVRHLTWVYIEPRPSAEYLVAAPLSQFEIVDNRISPSWKASYGDGELLLCPEVLTVEFFFDDLIEHVGNARERLAEIRAMLEKE